MARKQRVETYLELETIAQVEEQSDESLSAAIRTAVKEQYGIRND